MNECITTTTHVWLSLATTFFVWYLFVLPARSKNMYLNIFSIFVWGLILPLTTILTGASSDSTTGEDDETFTVIKFVSLMVAIFAINSFIWYFYINKRKNKNLLTGVLGFIFIANILEACVSQLRKYLDDQDIQRNWSNLFNSIVGFVLCLSVILRLYNNRMDMVCGKTTVDLQSNLGWWIILGYSFWNLLFRSALGEAPVVLLFLVLTLLFPIYTQFTGNGDWLHVRTITLLAYLVLITGLSPGEGRILPIYNNQCYDEENDRSPLTAIQKTDGYRGTLLGLGAITTLVSLVVEVKKIFPFNK